MEEDAYPDTTQDQEIQALEQTRQRIHQVTQSLEAIHRTLTYAETPPNWPTLQKSSHILLTNLQSLLRTTHETHSAILQSAHPYPLPSFPATAQHDMLALLLRKKQEPDVEDWVIEGLKHASSFCDFRGEDVGMDVKGVEGVGESKGGLGEEDFVGIWDMAGPWESEVAREIFVGEDEEEEDEDDEDEEEGESGREGDGDVKMGEAKEAEGPRLPLGAMLQFMSTGNVPRILDHAQLMGRR